MKRIAMVLFGHGAIVGGIFSLMAVAYGVGGLMEKLFTEGFFPNKWAAGAPKITFAGASGISNLIFLMLIFVMTIATLLTLAERKWSALMQDRIGPNRARFFFSDLDLAGIPHIATDVLKMLTKEDFQPRAASKLLFNLGPILAFGPVFALFAIVPAGPTVEVLGHKVMMAVANPNFGLLYMFAIASIAVYGTSLAGWASNNKFALLGGVRASSQMISYEVALGLSLVGMMMVFSTVQLAGPTGMAELQRNYFDGWSSTMGSLDVGLPKWGIVMQPIGFILFFAAAFAESKRAPFDVPEGESEIIGYFVEYSGMKFGLFMIAEFVEVVVLSGVLAAIFFGGCYLPFGNEWLMNLPLMRENGWLLGATLGTVFWLKVILLCYLQLAIRWTFPRFRYDQIQTLGWKILLPVGIVNLFVTGALILWDPSMKMLAVAGLVEIGIILLFTFIPKSREEEHDDHAHDAVHAIAGGH